MADPTPYHLLGVAEDASFEDIQAARDRLLQLIPTDVRQQEAIEHAYDMILMQRLRLRQEGKIAVPDRIRFAERSVATEVPRTPPPVVAPWRQWVGQWIAPPTPKETLGVALVSAALVALTWVSTVEPTFPLSLGLITSIYALYRKSRRLGRAFLLALAALVLGTALGWAVAVWLGGSAGASAAVMVSVAVVGLALVALFAV
ncbi:MAG: hypothetical protein OHK0012_01670 [Synechococcales cyanobacterium]